MSLDNFLQMYSNEKLVFSMIQKSIDNVIQNFIEWKEYSPFTDKVMYDDDYTLVNIYIYEEKTLTLVCMNGKLNLDYCYYTSQGDKLEKEYAVIASHKLNVNCNIQGIYQQVFEIYQDITTNNPSLDNCKQCKKCFSKKNRKADLFTNVCHQCEPFLFLSLKGILKKEEECHICFTKLIEESENSQKHTLHTFYKVSCCKDKTICASCIGKLKRFCSYCKNSQNSDCCNRECPFCKQCFRVKK